MLSHSLSLSSFSKEEHHPLIPFPIQSFFFGIDIGIGIGVELRLKEKKSIDPDADADPDNCIFDVSVNGKARFSVDLST